MSISDAEVDNYRMGLTREELDLAITARSISPYKKIIYQAIRDYGINFLTMRQHQPFFSENLLSKAAPSLIVVDDLSKWPCGPEGFDPVALSFLTRQSICISVISSGRYADVFSFLSLMTGLWRLHTMIIETRADFEQTWLNYVCLTAPESSLMRGAYLMEGQWRK